MTRVSHGRGPAAVEAEAVVKSCILVGMQGCVHTQAWTLRPALGPRGGREGVVKAKEEWFPACSIFHSPRAARWRVRSLNL